MKSVIQNTTLVPDGTSLVIAGGATVTVRDTGGTLVSLWSDRAGTLGVDNPYTADADGFFRVYATPAVVDVTITSGSNEQTFKNIILSGTIATQDADAVAITGGNITGITDLPVADGGTGASTAATARANLSAAGLIALPTTGNLISQTAGGDIQDAGVAASAVLTSVATADLPAGASVQTVQTVDTTNRTTTSTTYADSGVSVTLTPRNTSSKVRIRVSGIASNSAAAVRNITFTLYRGATDLTPSGVNGLYEALSTSNTDAPAVLLDFLDSPATASAVTYSLYWKVAADTGHLGRRGIDTNLDAPTIITAEEIAG